MGLLSYLYGGGVGVEEEGVAATGSGASRRCTPYGIGPSNFRCSPLSATNFGSCALSYRRCGGAHYPLIEGIALDQGGELDLVSCGPSPLEINSNNSKSPQQNYTGLKDDL
jgi:hypothetical protein